MIAFERLIGLKRLMEQGTMANGYNIRQYHFIALRQRGIFRKLV